MKLGRAKIAVFDFETDPFSNGRVPEPFACGYYDGETYKAFWGDDVIPQFMSFLDDQPKLTLFAHNGGKFDFYFLYREGLLTNPIKIMDGRITKAGLSKHTLRDSYKNVPIPLALFNKDSIDYAKMEKDVREDNKDEILSYMRTDVLSTYDLVTKFYTDFPGKHTMGSASMGALKELHPYGKLNETADGMIRPYYTGGMVRAIKPGIHEGNYTYVDVNSMYPYVMKRYKHPIGTNPLRQYPTMETLQGLIDEGIPFFADVDATCGGWLPFRTKEGLTYPKGRRRYHTTSHELKVCLERDLIKIHKIHDIMTSTENGSFGDFVDKYMSEKVDAKKRGDKWDEVRSKLILNSCYGKFGQNPENYFEYKIVIYDGANTVFPDEKQGWVLDLMVNNSMEIWKRPSPSRDYYNVGIAASITGAARSVLIEALNDVVGPMYCDTDSIICEDPGTLPLDKFKLGSWDVEAEGDMVAIHSPKTYVMYNNGEEVKLSAKGFRLTGEDIMHVCRGGTVKWKNDSPTFSLEKGPYFIERILR